MFSAYSTEILLSGIGLLVVSVLSVLALPLILARMPSDYFVRNEPPESSWRHRHPVLRWTLRILKNAVGMVLFLVGVMMLLTPGQGVLTILLALVLLDVPGKRTLELWLVRRPRVFAVINWMRQRANQPALQVPSAEKSHAELR